MSRLAALLALAALSAPGFAADLSTLTGKKYKGELKRVDANLLTFDAEIGQVAVPLKDLFVLDFGRTAAAPAAGAKYDELELTDGSVFRSTGIKIKGKAVEVALLPVAGTPGPTVTVPLGAVFAYLRGADVQKNRDDWKKLLATRGKRDLYVIRQGEDLSALPGTVVEGGEDGDTLTFEDQAGKRAPLRLSRATGGLVFNQPPRDVIPPTICKLLDLFGNSVFAAKIDLGAGGMTVATVAGATVTYPSTAGLVKLDFSRGNIAYLSDLDAAVSAPTTDTEVIQFAKDHDETKQPLKLADTAYAKGLLVPSETVVTYKLKDDFRELKAIVGMPDSGPPSGAAKLTVLADGRVLFAGPVTRKTKPKELVLDVKGVKELTIKVDAEERFTGNYVILAEARLQK
jgi:hypothetical protein